MMRFDGPEAQNRWSDRSNGRFPGIRNSAYFMDKAEYWADLCELKMKGDGREALRSLQDKSHGDPRLSVVTEAFFESGLALTGLAEASKVLSEDWWYGGRLIQDMYIPRFGWTTLPSIVEAEVKDLHQHECSGNGARLMYRLGWKIKTPDREGSTWYWSMRGPNDQMRTLANLQRHHNDSEALTSMSHPFKLFPDVPDAVGPLIPARILMVEKLGAWGFIPPQPRIRTLSDSFKGDELHTAMTGSGCWYAQDPSGAIGAYFPDLPELRPTGWTREALDAVVTQYKEDRMTAQEQRKKKNQPSDSCTEQK